MSKKFNWGWGLVLGFALFAAGILTMVMISMNRDVDLVADDYYQLELKHEDQIQSNRRTTALGDSLRVRITATSFVITLPSFFKRDSAAGSLTFYRPANRKRDFVVPLVLSSENRQEVATAGLERGLWRVKVRWQYRRQDYFHEEVLMLE